MDNQPYNSWVCQESLWGDFVISAQEPIVGLEEGGKPRRILSHGELPVPGMLDKTLGKKARMHLQTLLWLPVPTLLSLEPLIKGKTVNFPAYILSLKCDASTFRETFR